MKVRKPLPREAAARYRKVADRKEKSAMLNELVGYTGMNRKYLVHVMAEGNGKPGSKTAGKRRSSGGRKPIYSDEFAATLRSIWAFFWYRCGKILAPLIRENIRFLEKPFGIGAEVKALLMTASPATIDRVLRADKSGWPSPGNAGRSPGAC